MQVLAGDIEEAICTHAIYYSIWRRYSALPERFDWNTKTPNVKFYPLRPELVESTYLLYQVIHTASFVHWYVHVHGVYVVCYAHRFHVHNTYYVHVL